MAPLEGGVSVYVCKGVGACQVSLWVEHGSGGEECLSECAKWVFLRMEGRERGEGRDLGRALIVVLAPSIDFFRCQKVQLTPARHER
jgi:hypothetical protein